MVFNFDKHPELTNSQLNIYGFDSPHKQITEGFIGLVRKVTDGDSISVETDFRDFETKVRLAYINAPEMNEGGEESKLWLEDQILGQEVYIKVNPNNRVGKFGRIIGDVFSGGTSMSQLSLMTGNAMIFGSKFK